MIVNKELTYPENVIWAVVGDSFKNYYLDEDAFDDVLLCLSYKQLPYFLLIYKHGKSIGEVAKADGVSKSAVKQVVKRALQVLKDCYDSGNYNFIQEVHK